MAAPILRALVESGQVWDDPSEDLIFELLRDVESGEEQFLIIERTADASGETYAQVIAEPGGGWTIERRDGSADEHFAAEVAGTRVVHAALVAWAFDRPDLEPAIGWRRVSV